MNMKNNNDEILSRREFFKKTAKGALPFLAFGMFGPSILSACSKNEDEEWINQRTGERESDGSQGNDNNLSGTWIGSSISFVFNPDGSGTYVNAYSGESGSCTYKFTETNKGVIITTTPSEVGATSNGSQSVTYYFIVNGNTMSLYSDSGYTDQIAQLTKQTEGNNGGGNNNGGGCNDCSASCASSCGDGCSTSCYSSCAVECVGQCSSGCMGSCSSSCTGSCSTGCKNTCTYSCSGRSRL